MVSYPDLRDAEPDVFTDDAAQWQHLAGELNARCGDIDKQLSTLSEWQGDTATAAVQTLTTQRTMLADAATTTGKIPPVLTVLAATVTSDQSKLRDAMATAADNSLQIYDDGTVVSQDTPIQNPGQPATPNPMPESKPQPNPPSQAQLQQIASGLTTTIQDILRDATHADENAAAQLRALTAQVAGLAPAANDPTVTAAAMAVPGPNTSPADVTTWWNSLSPQQQESMLFMHGDQLGSLDGIPVAVRDRANRGVLAEDKSKLLEEKARTAADPSANTADGNTVDAKLDALSTIENRLATPVDPQHQQAYLMKLGTDGNGRAIIAMGNPDTATNVATYVPGTGAGLTHIGGDINRSDVMVGAAESAGSPSTAVITWVGYDAPQSLTDADSPSYADNAKGELQRFQDGLRATHVGPPSHNTVVGHSYGTTVVGHAASDGSLNANDIVNVASPGVGVDNVNGLHLTGVPQDQVGQHVHSTIAQHDPIGLALSTPTLGPLPTDPSFGGEAFTSAPGPAGPWYELGWNPSVHSDYWNPGNPSLTNIGDVIAGKPTS